MSEPQTLLDRVPTLPAPDPSTITENCYRHLYKLYKKRATHISHLCFLKTCLRNNIIPKGLGITTAPTVEEKGPGYTFWREWRHILQRTSILLMQILKQYYCTTTATYTEDIESMEKVLKKRIDFTRNKAIITQSITLLQHELAERKQRKIASILA